MLTHSEHLIIWAMRQTATCWVECRTVEAQFKRIFGPNHKELLQSFQAFWRALTEGRRRLILGGSDFTQPSRDEVSLLNLLAYAQDQNRVGFEATALWLLGRSEIPQRFAVAVADLAYLSHKHGLSFSVKGADCAQLSTDTIDVELFSEMDSSTIRQIKPHTPHSAPLGHYLDSFFGATK